MLMVSRCTSNALAQDRLETGVCISAYTHTFDGAHASAVRWARWFHCDPARTGDLVLDAHKNAQVRDPSRPGACAIGAALGGPWI